MLSFSVTPPKTSAYTPSEIPNSISLLSNFWPENWISTYDFLVVLSNCKRDSFIEKTSFLTLVIIVALALYPALTTYSSSRKTSPSILNLIAPATSLPLGAIYVSFASFYFSSAE